MKTHPDSIFTREIDLRELDDGGTSDLWSCRSELPRFDITTEFVPAAAYIELQNELATASAQLQTQTENMRALEKERDELRATVDKLTDKTLAIEEFHDRDTDGPYVLAEAYLMYRCVKCYEALCQDGSDEPIDGLTDDLNGYAVTCKCGVEYIGYTIDTPKLALIQAPPEPYDNEYPEGVPGFNYRG